MNVIEWKPEYQEIFDKRDYELLKKKLGLQKSSSRSKSDLKINHIQYSLKLKKEKPSIVNHTVRPAFERICTLLGIEINTLDEIILDYWNKREEGILTEDIKNDTDQSPFFNFEQYMMPILNYFIFTGSGAADSKFPADKVLVVNYSSLEDEMEIFDKEQYFAHVWNKLVFSMRGGGNSKRGMPKNYPECDNFDSVSKWTRKTNDGYKGALSVRVG